VLFDGFFESFDVVLKLYYFLPIFPTLLPHHPDFILNGIFLQFVLVDLSIELSNLLMGSFQFELQLPEFILDIVPLEFILQLVEVAPQLLVL
jgi:hypothetical protein